MKIEYKEEDDYLRMNVQGYIEIEQPEGELMDFFKSQFRVTWGDGEEMFRSEAVIFKTKEDKWLMFSNMDQLAMYLKKRSN